MPTSSADSQSTSAAMRRREKPSARSAAISPSRWFTDTVSSTVISRMPNDSVTNASAVGDLPEVRETDALETLDHLVVREGIEVGPRPCGWRLPRRQVLIPAVTPP